MQTKPNIEDIRSIESRLFRGLEDQQIQQVIEIMQVVEMEKGELVMKEGSVSDEVFIIWDGEVDVLKKEKESGEYFHLATLSGGESIGEMSLLDNEPRSASVVASKDSTLLKIGMSDLNSISSGNDSVSARIKINFAREMGRRLRKTNETTVTSLYNKLEEAHMRVAMGTIICWLLVGICLYVITLQYVTEIGNQVASTTLISVTILFVLGLFTVIAVKKTGYPLSMFGLKFDNGLKISLQAIVYSLPILLILLIVKGGLILFHPKMNDAQLLDWSSNLNIGRLELAGDILLYTLFTPVQEFIARGGVQSSFQLFLTHRYRTLTAILIANLMFSMTHVHLSTEFAVMVFLPGLFWGWLYSRQNSLLGVCVSHILIGLAAYYIIGFQALL